MNLVQDLKDNTELQDKVIAWLQAHPLMVKLLATISTYISLAYAPIGAFHTLIRKKNKQQVIELNSLDTQLLTKKLATYNHLMASVSDNMGFIETDCCDALLFTGLVGATGWQVAITAARNKDGSWERRETEHPCYPDGSASTISRDMITGLLWYFWRNKRLDLAMDMWNYGHENSWIMGEGDPTRLYMTPGLQATLAEIIFRLGGENFWFTRNMPQIWSKGLTGYQAHLQILHILLRGELNGFIDGSMEDALTDMNTTYPDNYLCTLARARYASSEYNANYIGTNAVRGLHNTALWPDDRLPSDADRVTKWYFMDNDTSKGTDPGQLHTGGDLVFCASLAVDYSK